jgi:hypothetical protein
MSVFGCPTLIYNVGMKIEFNDSERREKTYDFYSLTYSQRV